MPDEQWALCSTAVAAQGLAGNNSGSNVTERFVDGNTEREETYFDTYTYTTAHKAFVK